MTEVFSYSLCWAHNGSFQCEIIFCITSLAITPPHHHYHFIYDLFLKFLLIKYRAFLIAPINSSFPNFHLSPTFWEYWSIFAFHSSTDLFEIFTTMFLLSKSSFLFSLLFFFTVFSSQLMGTISSVRMINYRFLDDSSFLGFFLFILLKFLLFIFHVGSFSQVSSTLGFSLIFKNGVLQIYNCFFVWWEGMMCFCTGATKVHISIGLFS